MWPDSLRLATPERAEEGKAAVQPTQQQDTSPPLKHENPDPSGTGETLETPTPKPTVEEAMKTPILGEYIPVPFLNVYTCLPLVQVNRDTLRKNPSLHM